MANGLGGFGTNQDMGFGMGMGLGIGLGAQPSTQGSNNILSSGFGDQPSGFPDSQNSLGGPQAMNGMGVP